MWKITFDICRVTRYNYEIWGVMLQIILCHEHTRGYKNEDY